MAYQAVAYPGFCSVKQLGVFLLPLDGMLDHHWFTLSIKYASTHLYTRVERGVVRVKSLAQEHHAMSPCPRIARSRDQRTNHRAAGPQNELVVGVCGDYFLRLERRPVG